jgi:hypothetical protein
MRSAIRSARATSCCGSRTDGAAPRKGDGLHCCPGREDREARAVARRRVARRARGALARGGWHCLGTERRRPFVSGGADAERARGDAFRHIRKRRCLAAVGFVASRPAERLQPAARLGDPTENKQQRGEPAMQPTGTRPATPMRSPTPAFTRAAGVALLAPSARHSSAMATAASPLRKAGFTGEPGPGRRRASMRMRLLLPGRAERVRGLFEHRARPRTRELGW